MLQRRKSGANKKRVKSPRVALHLPKDAKSLLPRCQAIWAAVKADPTRFGSPYPDPKKIEADLAALADALQAVEAGGAGSQDAVQKAEEAVRIDFAMLARYVESVVRDGSVDDAAETISRVLMHVSKIGQRAAKPELGTKRTAAAGVWLLLAAAVESAVAYFWEQSTDQVTWTALPPTPQTTTSVSGLAEAQTYYFRFRVLLRDGSMSEASQVVSLRS